MNVIFIEPAFPPIQREFVRMLLGSETPFDRAEKIFAIAGPELG